MWHFVYIPRKEKLSTRIEGEMMLRSASTPSLVSSLTAKSPARHQASPPPAAACGQVSCKCSSGSGHVGFPRSRVNSPEGPDATEIRRAQSAGNLEETFNVEEFSLSRQSSRRLSRMPTLEAIPSYDNDDDEEEEEEDEEEDLNLFTVQNLAGLEAGTREFNGFCDVGEGKMYLASGIGLNAVGFLEDGGFGGRGGGGGGSSRPGDGFRDGGGDNRGLSLEDHYKSMLMQDPCNPLLLRNYAQFLYQAKGDLSGAEEYYSRALLADPEDGDIMCQYARVVWELHHDKQRAQSYFERAIQASSGECNISASYASFLWDIEDDEDDDEGPVIKDPKINPHLGAQFLYHGIMASATA